MSDTTNPPAIVRPADFADRLTALMAQAQAFGRKTIEQKVACGNALIQAMEEIDRRNAEAKPKDRVVKLKVLARFGFSKPTAWRLMTAARSHNQRFILKRELDGIYDDGIDPTLDADKKPCRDCRVRGKEFSPKCASCRALNRPVPKPREEKPVTDMDGNPVPEPLLEIFQDGESLRQFNADVLTALKTMKGLTERPGCAALNFDEAKKRLTSLAHYVWKHRPGLPCPECGGAKCEKCGHRGFRTVLTVADERAKEANAKKAEQAKEWREKQSRRNDHIPE